MKALRPAIVLRFEPALTATDAPPATSSPVDLGVEDPGGYDLVESDAWLCEEIADRPSPVTEAEGPVVLPAHTDLLYDLSAQESLLETETADDANDLTFLEELDQVDWLPDVREGPVSEEVTIEDELLADLDLQELGDVLAPARNLEPEADVAPVWDLPDTTNDARAPHRDYAPPDDFSFDDEQPAWLRGQDGDEPKSSPSRGLPEWLRPPDEDQH